MKTVVKIPVTITKMKTVVKIPVIESEKGWGRKIDDYMVCMTVEDAELFRGEFNSTNDKDNVPEWYMAAEGDVVTIEITEEQFEHLNKKDNKRMRLETLNK